MARLHKGQPTPRPPRWEGPDKLGLWTVEAFREEEEKNFLPKATTASELRSPKSLGTLQLDTIFT